MLVSDVGNLRVACFAGKDQFQATDTSLHFIDGCFTKSQQAAAAIQEMKMGMAVLGDGMT